jgi:hypothetical protein
LKYLHLHLHRRLHLHLHLHLHLPWPTPGAQQIDYRCVQPWRTSIQSLFTPVRAPTSHASPCKCLTRSAFRHSVRPLSTIDRGP